MSVTEISFLPPPAGTPLPAQGGLPDTGMNDQDQEGWASAGNNQRVTVVADPLGGPSSVFRFAVGADDTADHWGGCRAEYWRNPHDLLPGMESWHALSWHLPADFTTGTATWCALMQLHGDDTNSPVQSFGTTHGDLICGYRKLPADPWGTDVVLGKLPLGGRVYLLLHVRHATDASGLAEFRHGLAPPDPLSPPSVSWSGATVAGANSWTKVGLYRDPNGGGFPTVAFLYGLGRAATAARAMELAGWTVAALAPTNAELRDFAEAELAKTTITYPAWVKAGKPASSHWTKAFAALEQIQ